MSEIGWAQMQSNQLCDWRNATAGRNPATSFEICLYPNAGTTDILSAFIVEKRTWEAGYVNYMLNVMRNYAPDQTVLVDIGANVGFYTLAAATTGVAVHAFEPSLRNALMLQMSLQRNSVQHRVLLSTFALSDKAEPMALGTSEQNQGNLQHARLGSRVRIFKKPTPPSRGTHIAAFRLDDVLQAAPQAPVYLKIDVEGGECAVIRGMRRFLHRADIWGVHIEMQNATRTCCIQDNWTETGGFFHLLYHRHKLRLVARSRTSFLHPQFCAHSSWDVLLGRPFVTLKQKRAGLLCKWFRALC